MRPERSRPTASRSISTPPPRTASCPISMRSRPSCSPARSRSISPRRRTRKARSPTPPISQRLIALARQHGFMLFADECYSEIYWKDAPPGMLEQAGSDFANVAVFHSLSKRSSLPGLRIGFIAGDKTLHQAVPRPALGRGTAGAGAGAGGRDRGLQRRDPRAGEPRALSRQVRSRRPDHRQSLRLQAPGRRLLPLARRVAAGRQRRPRP